LTVDRRVLSWIPLGFVPLAVALEWFTPERHIAIFAVSMLAIMPLAGYIGHATDDLAARLGGGIGGLLNATFGNIAELIIGAFALHNGLYDLVKASITGSIIGNVLLVFGASALVGGLRHPLQRFNRTAAGMGTTMMLLSAIGLVVPAVFHHLASRYTARELTLDTEIAAVLFLTYAAGLVFTLKTHRQLFGRAHDDGGDGDEQAASRPSMRASVITLVAATAAVAVVSEVLVDAVSEAATALGMSQLFVGVIIVALVGNAAEHYTAVTMAARDRMDAAIAIAVGSSTQIALFVAPVLVFLSYAIAPEPMNLRFTTFELVAIGLAVLAIASIAHDGETNWMEGLMLLAVYAILALGFYFLPA
jgi:Ca2+:H+ antiporter